MTRTEFKNWKTLADHMVANYMGEMKMQRFIKAMVASLACVAAFGANTQIPESGFITDEWSAGSIPPPWHSQHNHGPKHRFRRDRHDSWVSQYLQRRAALGRFIDDTELQKPGWWARTGPNMPPRPLPSGSSNCTIGVVKLIGNSSTGFTVPCNDNDVYEPYLDKKNDFVKAIKDVVPKEAWEQLDESMRKYVGAAAKK